MREREVHFIDLNLICCYDTSRKSAISVYSLRMYCIRPLQSECGNAGISLSVCSLSFPSAAGGFFTGFGGGGAGFLIIPLLCGDDGGGGEGEVEEW